MKRTAIVQSSELGTNCWLPRRFIESARCDRVYTCSYREKSTCKAIQAEITYLKEKQSRMVEVSSNIDKRVEELAEMLKK